MSTDVNINDEMNIARNASKVRTLASSIPRQKVLTVESMNENVKAVQYAVRGPIVIRAGEIENELKTGKKYPFDEVIKCNIGDAHAMGQGPITYIRQVVSGAAYPDLLEAGNNNGVIPADASAQARRILDGCGGGSLGAYSNSAGVQVIRDDIARYIEQRDGIGSVNSENVVMSTGASGAIVALLKMLVRGPNDGIMIPIPQYPLYSACLAEFNATVVPYFLNEEKNWSLDLEELERSYSTSEVTPKAICIINPGNPTGQVQSYENIRKVLEFAYQKRLFVLADEVYQDNIYADGMEFHSFRKVMLEMGEPYASQIELASFHSTSKGYMGECGFRSGYMETVNLDKDVKTQLTKLISSRLCPPVPGQAAMDVVVNPPKPGDESYELFSAQKAQVLADLKYKAKLVADTFNAIEGITCQTVQGAMYAFPNIQLPDKFIKEANAKGLVPDAYYCSLLLEETGICVVPGSGFRQKAGTWHFRTTILPPKEKMEKFARLFTKFHLSILAKYEPSKK